MQSINFYICYFTIMSDRKLKHMVSMNKLLGALQQLNIESKGITF